MMQMYSMLDWLTEYTDYDGTDKIVEFDDLTAAGDEAKLNLALKMAEVNTKFGQEVFNPNQALEIAGYEKKPEFEDDFGDDGKGESIEEGA